MQKKNCNFNSNETKKVSDILLNKVFKHYSFNFIIVEF